MNDDEIIKYVESCIKQLKEKFEGNPYYFIDGKEGDIQAYLYHLIAKEDYFLKEFDYKQDKGGTIKTCLLHSEAKTQHEVGSRTGRFDIAILDSTQKRWYLVAIELKWVQTVDLETKNGKDNIQKIKKDIDKLSNKENDVKRGFLLIFNNATRFTTEFQEEIENYKNKKNPNITIEFIESKVNEKKI